MLKVNQDSNVYICTQAVDMRKAINGLSILVVELLESNPSNGDAYIFWNKRKNQIKLLSWHKNGFVLFQKRLEKGTFKIPKQFESQEYSITAEQFDWLLAGLDFVTMGEFPEINFSHYA